MSGSAQFTKASRIRLPNDIRKLAAGVAGTQEVARVAANDFGVKKIAVTTTHGQEALEYAWSGQFVYFIFDGAAGDVVHLAATDVSGGEVDRAASATNNTTTPANVSKAGVPVFADQGPTPFQLPEWDRNQTGYLLHEGSAAGTLYMILG